MVMHRIVYTVNINNQHIIGKEIYMDYSFELIFYMYE